MDVESAMSEGHTRGYCSGACVDMHVLCAVFAMVVAYAMEKYATYVVGYVNVTPEYVQVNGAAVGAGAAVIVSSLISSGEPSAYSVT